MSAHGFENGLPGFPASKCGIACQAGHVQAAAAVSYNVVSTLSSCPGANALAREAPGKHN
jgi:hypothetical protein